jgi:hypothetical protein
MLVGRVSLPGEAEIRQLVGFLSIPPRIRLRRGERWDSARDVAHLRCNGSNRPNMLKTCSPLTHSSMAIFVHVGTDFPQPPIARSASRHLIPESKIFVPDRQHDLAKRTSIVPTPSAQT